MFDGSEFKFIKIVVILLLVSQIFYFASCSVELLYVYVLEPYLLNYRLVVKYSLQTFELIVHLLDTHAHLLCSQLFHRLIVLGCFSLLFYQLCFVSFLPCFHPIYLALYPFQIELDPLQFMVDMRQYLRRDLVRSLIY